MGYFERYMRDKEARQHLRIRTALRIGGWALLLLGAIFLISGIRVASLDRGGPPWGIFLGTPMIAIALNLLHTGYIKMITGYYAGEMTPPVTRSLKYMADELTPSVRAMTQPMSPAAPSPVVASPAANTPVGRMKQLELLRKKELISQEEYEKKRQEILNSL